VSIAVAKSKYSARYSFLKPRALKKLEALRFNDRVDLVVVRARKTRGDWFPEMPGYAGRCCLMVFSQLLIKGVTTWQLRVALRLGRSASAW
jgi:hypothetical protein